jgi:multidrug resistance efflux pump
MGEDLKFIDFHQLQIENKKHVKDIDDRNKKLLKLKLDSGKIVQKLNVLKKNLTEATKEQEELERKLSDYNSNLLKKKDDIKKTGIKIKKANKDYKVYKATAAQNQSKPKPITFVEQKNTAQDLRAIKKNWERKIEIAELEARKARAILRKHQVQEMETGYNFEQ